MSLNPAHDEVYSIQHNECDKICQWLAAGQWFSSGTPVSSTNKTVYHNITEIMLKVALNTITQVKSYKSVNRIPYNKNGCLRPLPSALYYIVLAMFLLFISVILFSLLEWKWIISELVLEIQFELSKGMRWDPINWFNSATFLCPILCFFLHSIIFEVRSSCFVDILVELLTISV